MSHDRDCKSKKDKKKNEVGNVPLESYYYYYYKSRLGKHAVITLT